MKNKIILILLSIVIVFATFNTASALDLNTTTADIDTSDNQDTSNITEHDNIVIGNSSTDTVLTSNNLTKYYGESGTYSVVLTDSNNNPLVNQYIKIMINSVTYIRTTDENGTASLNINLYPGQYGVTSTFSGNSNYSSSTVNGNVLVLDPNNDDPKDQVFIKSENFKEYFGENKPFIITLVNRYNQPIANQNVVFTVNGVSYTKATDNNGQARLTIRLGENTYNIQTEYAGNSYYQSAKAQNTIIVQNPTHKTVTTLISSDFTEYYGENRPYTVKLVSGTTPLVYQNVDITVNGVTYTKTTDENGEAKLNIRLNSGTYTITSSYSGNALYEATWISPINTVTVLAANYTNNTILSAQDFEESFGENKAFTIYLKDENGNPLSLQNINININGVNYSKTTDNNGVASLIIRLNPGIYTITTSYAGHGVYNGAATIQNKVTVYETIFIDKDATNSEIQEILDNVDEKVVIRFSGDSYNNISLIINNPVIINSQTKATLNGNENGTVLTINCDDVVVENLNIAATNGNGITVNGKNTIIKNNTLTNTLDEEKMDQYNQGTLLLPGNGIAINSDDNEIINNEISYFYNGICLENAVNTNIQNNTIRKNNYGITFEYNVSNTNIENNDIIENIGYEDMTVVEGPLGYGISVKDSGVNITIYNNRINNNYMGIYIDAKNCTGIVIIGNEITNSTIEGLTFNVNYTFAENAVQPVVESNAIYNNAKGPSMIILGEVSANPEGIYGPGEWDDSLKLVLGSNWYGTNVYTTWGENVTGAGTICPRINTTLITYALNYTGNNSYNVFFYKDGEIANELPDFETYFTLNYGTEKAYEVKALIQDGVGTIQFPEENYFESGNVLYGSSGSLYDPERFFYVTYTYNIPDSEVSQ